MHLATIPGFSIERMPKKKVKNRLKLLGPISVPIRVHRRQRESFRKIAVEQAVPRAKKRRQDNESNAASFLNTWVGKKVILGESCKVKKKYLGKHAVVSSEAPNGWVDICIVENGTKGDHVKWRKSGLIELTTDQSNLAQSGDLKREAL